MTEDFYDLLDVPSDASQDEIKDAYREQVRVYHPDLNDDDRAQAQFTAVKKAYDILGDPVERQAYDRLGHEEYVAKRTSGLPSPDVWKSSDDSSDADETSTDRTEATATAGSSSAGTSGSATASTATGSSAGTSSSTGSGGSSSTASTGTGTGTTASSAGASTTANGTAGGTTSSTDGGTARATGHGTAGSSSSSRSRSTAETGWLGDNAVARWWRRQNFSLPLIWLSVLIYLAGLGQFALDNESGLETLRAELTSAGDAGAILEGLTAERYGIDSSLEYLTAFELVAPPLEESLWYAALAGAVALTLLVLLGIRVSRDEETWGPVSIDETIVVALAVTATTVLVGGPLLTGAVLMPMLFAVIVRHTRRGAGWTPSYVYLVPVLAPLVGFGLAAAGAATLATDLAALVVLPLIGGLALPLRATIRKRFGR